MFVLAGTAYGFKVLGLVVVGDRVLPPVLDRCLALIPPALIAAIVVNDTFTVAQHTLGIDRATRGRCRCGSGPGVAQGTASR